MGMKDFDYKVAVYRTRQALTTMRELTDLFDPNADYSDEQVLLIAAQILGGIAPSVNLAIEALNRLGES